MGNFTNLSNSINSFCERAKGQFTEEDNLSGCLIARGRVSIKLSVSCDKNNKCSMIALTELNGERVGKAVLNDIERIEEVGPTGPRWLDFEITGYGSNSDRLSCIDNPHERGCTVESKNTFGGASLSKFGVGR